MQVARWGNSLAIRIPARIAKALGLKEGDDVNILIAGERAFDIEQDRSRAQAIARIEALRKPLPAGWKFDRAEANAR